MNACPGEKGLPSHIATTWNYRWGFYGGSETFTWDLLHKASRGAVRRGIYYLLPRSFAPRRAPGGPKGPPRGAEEASKKPPERARWDQDWRRQDNRGHDKRRPQKTKTREAKTREDQSDRSQHKIRQDKGTDDKRTPEGRSDVMPRKVAASLHDSTNSQHVFRKHGGRGHFSRRQLTSRAFNARAHSRK